MFGLNRDEEHRDKIIFGKYEPEVYVGGIRRFDDLKVSQLLDLLCNNFICWNEGHNNAPDVRGLLGYLVEYLGYKLSGYAVSARRDDYRVSIDGIEKDGGTITKKEQEAFEEMFGGADDFEVSSHRLYAWFD